MRREPIRPNPLGGIDGSRGDYRIAYVRPEKGQYVIYIEKAGPTMREARVLLNKRLSQVNWKKPVRDDPYKVNSFFRGFFGRK